MPTLLDRGSWCITPRNWEYNPTGDVPRAWVQNTVNVNDFSECIFPLEGKILFFGADVQNPDLTNLEFILKKNGSTEVARLQYGASESGIKGVVLNAVYFEDDWWNLEMIRDGPGFVVRAGLMIAGKL